ARKDEAARDDLSGAARAARRSTPARGDDRRRSRRRHRRRARRGDARVARRPRRPLSGSPAPADRPAGASRSAGAGARIWLMEGWVIWAILAVALALGELLTPG